MILHTTEFKTFVNASFDANDVESILAAGREAKAQGNKFLTGYAAAAYRVKVDSLLSDIAATTPAPQPAALTPGYYTVEFEGGDYVTLRVQDDFRANPDPNCKVVGYLNGPDNHSDYTGFAFVVGGDIRTWNRFRGMLPRQHEAVKVLMGSTDVTEYGFAFAKMSGRCARCGRMLTVPASLNRGYGPECAKKLGE
jgi:hypothetical protein